jgi:hypothetical protein
VNDEVLTYEDFLAAIHEPDGLPPDHVKHYCLIPARAIADGGGVCVQCGRWISTR